LTENFHPFGAENPNFAITEIWKRDDLLCWQFAAFVRKLLLPTLPTFLAHNATGACGLGFNLIS